jgi:UDP-N-acetyl-D-mannosaminuronate dehydrogenase
MLKLRDKLERNDAIVAIIGLGYVGLPLAREFSKMLKVIGYDIDIQKIDELSKGNDDIYFTTNPNDIAKADFVIITVPTPVTKSKQPDLL